MLYMELNIIEINNYRQVINRRIISKLIKLYELEDIVL